MGFYRFQAALNRVRSKAAHPTAYRLRLLMPFLLPAALKSRFRIIIIGFQNMPFTLAHPIAVLPFSRCRYCHFPALVIGSLSPDFVYFLHGRAVSGGHGLADMLWPNLALCFAVYWLYLALWRDALSDFLPNALIPPPIDRLKM